MPAQWTVVTRSRLISRPPPKTESGIPLQVDTAIDSAGLRGCTVGHGILFITVGAFENADLQLVQFATDNRTSPVSDAGAGYSRTPCSRWQCGHECGAGLVVEGPHFQIVLVDLKTMLNVPHPTMPSEQQLGTERFIPPGNNVAVSATCKLA